MSNWVELIGRGTRADQPDATLGAGQLYCVTDEDNIVERSNGATWEAYSPSTATPTAHATSHQNGGDDEISVAGLSGLLADGQTPLAHKTSHQSGGSDAIKLDDLAAPDDNTDLNVSTSAHGLTPKAPNDATKFLDGTGAWSTPVGAISDTAYNESSWNAVTAVAPSKNAVRDKFEALPGELISDTAYAGSWNGVTAVAPSKNAVYDQMEKVVGYDVTVAIPGEPADSAKYVVVFNRAVSFAANWSGSNGKVLTNPTSTWTVTVKKNGSTVGTVAVGTGGSFTFATSGGATVSVSSGDYFTFELPTADATLADVGFTLAGTMA